VRASFINFKFAQSVDGMCCANLFPPSLLKPLQIAYTGNYFDLFESTFVCLH